jgi:hypothetical protein
MKKVWIETAQYRTAQNSTVQIRGFAASRAESLWLSVMPLETQRLRLGRRSREKSDGLNGKPEAFRTGGGKAACTLYRGVKAACALYRGGKAALRVVP